MIQASRLLRLAPLILCGALLACDGPAGPEGPGDDTPRSALAVMDSAMARFMATHEIRAGLLGVMKEGEVLLEQGYGWRDAGQTTPLPDDAMMRLASVTKPLTAALIQELAAEGELSLTDHAFELGQPGGGILDLQPFPGLGDPRLSEVTILNLLQHRGGWDRDLVGDLTYREVQISEAMGIDSPPGRSNTVRYILGQPLQFAPGAESAYSNIGYLVLGLIVEEVTGEDYLAALHRHVLGPSGVGAADVIQGRTFPADRSPREPWYDSDDLATNVFDPAGPPVRRPEGGWDHEARVGQGGLVATPGSILELLDRHIVSGDQIGARRSGTEGSSWRRNHTGSLPGTNALARQRGDGINYVVLFNRRPSTGSSYASLIRTELDALLDTGTLIWP